MRDGRVGLSEGWEGWIDCQTGGLDWVRDGRVLEGLLLSPFCM